MGTWIPERHGSLPVEKPFSKRATPRGFEPLRAEPNGFLVHLLNHSDTVSSQLNQPSRRRENPPTHRNESRMFTTKPPPAGLEPAIFGLEVQRVIHYATRASRRSYKKMFSCCLQNTVSVQKGKSQWPGSNRRPPAY